VKETKSGIFKVSVTARQPLLDRHTALARLEQRHPARASRGAVVSCTSSVSHPAGNHSIHQGELERSGQRGRQAELRGDGSQSACFTFPSTWFVGVEFSVAMAAPGALAVGDLEGERAAPVVR
jgi:hypothetical protein